MAQTHIEVNTVPSQGLCVISNGAVSADNPKALSTLFGFKCSGWRDQHQPLSYQFGFYDVGSEELRLFEHQQHSELESILPPGTLELKAFVRDALGAVTEVPMGRVTVGNPTGAAALIAKTMVDLEFSVNVGDRSNTRILLYSVLKELRALREAGAGEGATRRLLEGGAVDSLKLISLLARLTAFEYPSSVSIKADLQLLRDIVEDVRAQGSDLDSVVTKDQKEAVCESLPGTSCGDCTVLAKKLPTTDDLKGHSCAE